MTLGSPGGSGELSLRSSHRDRADYDHLENVGLVTAFAVSLVSPVPTFGPISIARSRYRVVRNPALSGPQPLEI
jgi:hypothetical protein